MTMTETEAAELFRSEPDGYLDVGAGEAAYRRAGNGPDVLFVHGWPLSGATWRKMLPYLVDHVTCHVVDFPSAGSSRFDADTPMSIHQHITSLGRMVDALGVDEIAVVAHDSGGMIARHAMVDDPRLRALGLINTEPAKPSWRFTSFIAARRIPGLAAGLGWVAGKPRIRRNKFVFGDAFTDRSLLEGDFAEFFFEPLNCDPLKRNAAAALLRSFDMAHVTELPAIHARIDVPVTLVWGDNDPFFPIEQARAMVREFPKATLHEIPGVSIFSHEEAPAEVAEALLPALVGDTAPRDD